MCACLTELRSLASSLQTRMRMVLFWARLQVNPLYKEKEMKKELLKENEKIEKDSDVDLD